ncbi:MAG: hypothetical protein WHT29_10055 [Bacteroidales bacterium]
MKTYYSIFIVVIIFFISCYKNDGDITTDYRDKYIGSYNCHKVGSFWCNSSSIPIDTMEIIDIIKNEDSSIIILNEKLKISIDGKFGGRSHPTPNYRIFDGYFTDDSIYFDTYQGGLGCFTTLNYKGKKIIKN